MKIHDLDFEIFIAEDEIRKKISHLAVELNHRLRDKNPVFIIVLNGAYLFGADLTRQFTGHCEIAFSRIKSYEGTSSSEIRNFTGFPQQINDRHVVIIEDIVDTGKTLFHLLNELKSFRIASVTTVALLQKNIAGPYLIKGDLIGFEIPDVFVVGYGLDYNEAGRNLPDIWKVV